MIDAPTAKNAKCTRCRHKHAESDRGKTRPDSCGMTTSTCPRCGGFSFYRLEGEQESKA